MWRFLMRRWLQWVPLFFVLTMLMFGLARSSSGGLEAIVLAGENPLDPADTNALRVRWGLDDPLPIQYGKWLYNVTVRGDLGRSYVSQSSVATEWAARIPATATLLAASVTLAFAIAVMLAAVAAARPRSWSGRIVNTVGVVGSALPEAWVVLIVAAIFLRSPLPDPGFTANNAGQPPGDLGWWAALRHLVLPVVATGLTVGLSILEQTRSAITSALASPFAQTARAKGLSESVVLWQHAVRNAFTAVMAGGTRFAVRLVGTALFAEAIFGWHGIGWLSLRAVGLRDYPLVVAFLLYGFCAVACISIATDVVQVALDPRLRRETEMREIHRDDRRSLVRGYWTWFARIVVGLLMLAALGHFFVQNGLSDQSLLAGLLRGGGSVLSVCLPAALVAAGIGTAVGLATGWGAGTWYGAAAGLTTKAVGSLPQPVLAIGTLGLMPHSVLGEVLILAIVVWPAVADQTKTAVRRLSDQAYVEAARAAGADAMHLVRRHVLHSLGLHFSSGVSACMADLILLKTGLDFLGLRLSATEAGWGQILAAGQAAFPHHIGSIVLPGMAAGMAALAFRTLSALPPFPGAHMGFAVPPLPRPL